MPDEPQCWAVLRGGKAQIYLGRCFRPAGHGGQHRTTMHGIVGWTDEAAPHSPTEEARDA